MDEQKEIEPVSPDAELIELSLQMLPLVGGGSGVAGLS